MVGQSCLNSTMPKKTIDKNLSELEPVPASFEAAMAELNDLVTQMESGKLALEASVHAYQRGAQLVQFCASQLEQVEQQVKFLEEGMLKPFVNAGQENNL